jgi:amino acid adenylation domain-containing protein
MKNSTLPLINDRDRQLLNEWNHTQADYPLDRCFSQLFEQQVARTPDAVAVIFNQQQLTYHQLNARANRWARHLVKLGVGLEKVVALMGDRNIDFLTAILAIFKAGGAYLPLNPAHPVERNQQVLAQSQVPLLLAAQNLKGMLSPIVAKLESKPQLLDLEDLDALEYASDNLAVRSCPDNLAYVIYTSGSTGTPKGAMLEQRGMVNHLYAKIADLNLTADDIVAQTASQTFDISIWQFLVALLVGGKVEIISTELAIDPTQILAYVEARQISILEIVPSLLRGLLQQIEVEGIEHQLTKLRWLLLTGEPLPPQLARGWLTNYPLIPILNAYGPTECSDDVTHYPIACPPAPEIVNIPIGKAVGNTQLYILDSQLQILPIGVAGELYVGGAGVGRGYLNNPTLTARAFLPNPFNPQDSPRLYKTGDKARYLADGNIEFLGRIDYQVKIRGNRIELGEIETVLSQHPQVREVVVIAREDRPGDIYLAAYMVVIDAVVIANGKAVVSASLNHRIEASLNHRIEASLNHRIEASLNHRIEAPLNHRIETSELRDLLKQKLPEYMVPGAFVYLASMPLTPNGKIDRKALPVPDLDLNLPIDFAPPTTPTQEILAKLWAEILHLPQVGIHDNFFELGGHSLLATQVIIQLRPLFGVELPLRRLFELPTIFLLSELIEASQGSNLESLDPLVERSRWRSLAFGNNQRIVEMSQVTEIVPVSRQELLPLSFAQARLWFLNQLEGGSATYNMPESLQLTGYLDIAALKLAVEGILQRHEILRTSFQVVEGEPIQVISSSFQIAMPLVDLQHLEGEEQSNRLQSLAIDQLQQPFDLSVAPLLRVTLVRLGLESHVLLITIHHIIADGWSMGIFVDELSGLYQAAGSRIPAQLPELPIQYADFARWQRQWLTGDVLQNQVNYWKHQLADAPPLLELPLDRSRPSMQTFRGNTTSFEIDRESTQQLKLLSLGAGATLFMTLLAAFATLLSRYSRQEDIVIGSPIANRNHSGIESLIGFFVNTLVLRTKLDGDPTFVELLARVREMTLSAYEHQDLPFEKLVEELQPERSLSYTPLFQVMFVLQNAPVSKLELPELTITPFKLEQVAARFDLTLQMTETAAGLTGELIYNRDLFDPSTIDRLAGHFQILLAGIIADAQQRVAQLPLMSSAEQQQLLIYWNDTHADYPQDKCIHQLFEAQVEQTPNAIAVQFESTQLTYRELNARSNQLARYLQTLGVKSEVLVGICVERSLEMIIGLLGILKAGGAYVPLDPAYPADRLSFMLADSQVAVLLTQQKLLTSLPDVNVPIIELDGDWDNLDRQSTTNPNTPLPASNLAYVIYTSGSTGKPKGVLVQHQGLCNLALAQIRGFDVRSDSRVLQFASFSFDASISEVVMSLCAGATLYLGTRDDLLPGKNLMELLHHQQISHITLSPSALAAMPSGAYPDLRTIIVAGEACPPDVVAQWSPGRLFLNGYGPTESTVCTTIAICTASKTAPPIGRPIDNIQVYILDGHLQPVPIGVAGELHIGGAGLARGYLNRPELTTEKFIPNPFSSAYSGRLYKTGDLVRYLPDGSIEFLGRIDLQVKIRGFRIELGEIEAVLSLHPQIREAVVVVRIEPTGKRLVAYIVPQSASIPTSELRSFLAEQLAEYMLPSAFVMLESLPLTPNGKIDRAALANLALAQSELDRTAVLPTTPIETILASIWADILGLEQVGIHHNFFELGGHSLLATQVISRIHDALQVDLPLRTLFERQTIADLAQTVVQHLADDTEDEEMARILAELEQM